MTAVTRRENPEDIAAIESVTRAAFASHPHSNQTEHLIVNALRASDALTVSLVVEVEGRLVGHLAFSPVTISDGAAHWYGLGPVSIAPQYQGLGLGSRLIRVGLLALARHRANGCVVLGDPRFYGRFGFRVEPAMLCTDAPAELFQALLLRGRMPKGTVAYHAAFNQSG